METNRNHSNEPTVGINFFESIPPVGLDNHSFRSKNHVDLKYMPNTVENKQTKHDNIRVNELQNKAVVKGFGSTALFTAALLAVSKQQGDRIRLDDDGINKHSILCNAEDICERNPTTVRKYYDEEHAQDVDIICKAKTSEDENMCIAIDYMDEIFASDYPLKSSNLNKTLEEYVQ